MKPKHEQVAERLEGLANILDEEIEELTERRDQFQATAAHLREMGPKHEEKIHSEISQLEAIVDIDDAVAGRLSEKEYERELEDIERHIRNERANVFPEHPKIEEAAKKGNKSTEDVIDDLKERNPDLPGEAFLPYGRGGSKWSKKSY